MSHIQNTLTPTTKVPLYVVGSSIGLAVLLTFQWANLRDAIRESARDSVTESQARAWIDAEREVNGQNANVKWLSLPEKPQSVVLPDAIWTVGDVKATPTANRD